MSAKQERWVYAIVIAVMLIVIGHTLTFEYQEPKILPLIVSVMTVLLAAAGLLRTFIKRRARPEKPSHVDGGEATIGWRRYVASVAWILGLLLGIYVIGLLTSLTLFTAAYMKAHGTRWLTTLIYTATIPLIVYFALEIGFGVTLYRGLLFEMFS